MSNLKVVKDIYGSKNVSGSVEFIIRDRNGNIVQVVGDHNIIKIGMKEVIPRRLTPQRVWDPTAGTGDGAWVDGGLELDEFVPRYIWFGASFDDNHQAIGSSDTRFYHYDSGTAQYLPNQLSPGLAYNGGLINPIPIADPDRPLKRVERVFYEPSYQPAGNPLISDDVRSINNIIYFETTLHLDEYNGFNSTASDYFDISEVALIAAREVDITGACECDPRTIFRQGQLDDTPLLAMSNGTSTVTLDPTMNSYATLIQEGDQIEIVASGNGGDAPDISLQPNRFYMVLSKSTGGSDLTLDRIPVSYDGTNYTPLSGPVGVYREGHKVIAHRITSPLIKKNGSYMITCRWKLTMG